MGILSFLKEAAHGIIYGDSSKKEDAIAQEVYEKHAGPVRFMEAYDELSLLVADSMDKYESEHPKSQFQPPIIEENVVAKTLDILAGRIDWYDIREKIIVSTLNEHKDAVQDKYNLSVASKGQVWSAVKSHHHVRNDVILDEVLNELYEIEPSDVYRGTPLTKFDKTCVNHFLDFIIRYKQSLPAKREKVISSFSAEINQSYVVSNRK